MRSIDLNADLGEGFGDYRLGDDAGLMALISSANVACGFHAGDAAIMASSVSLAKQYGVDLGAHVGFPDLQGFGRRRMQIEPATLAHFVTYQLGALAGFARSADYPLTHMSFHGALGNMAAEDESLARPLLQAVRAFDPTLIISTTSDNAVERCARELGLNVACTFLADRAYQANGLLVPRGTPGAVIHDLEQVSQRVIDLLKNGAVSAIDGTRLPMNISSILLHGDTPGALALIARLRRDIVESGVEIRSLSQQKVR
ncbi:LamB/YcsF family protein [Erwinia sorbitola]|uniref:5-oxoprolinase subunit A n=1 Tax=Erwinia sorbitola TaxID=2681984 RepID=A0A6I6EPW8_9GAMM|nr:5-oxoprolinase subunit PxpA [Erwinia sorbitola]QGU87119.1 5-oxoprolinase subunit PxpA [Erwinia sorbitola]